jgi:hypothetical protein
MIHSSTLSDYFCRMQSLIGSIPKWLPVPDAYDLNARIFPALIVMMPIIPAAGVPAVFHKTLDWDCRLNFRGRRVIPANPDCA